MRLRESEGARNDLARAIVIVEDVEAKIERVAAAALKNPDDIIYATPVALSVPVLRDSILALDAFSRALD